TPRAFASAACRRRWARLVIASYTHASHATASTSTHRRVRIRATVARTPPREPGRPRLIGKATDKLSILSRAAAAPDDRGRVAQLGADRAQTALAERVDDARKRRRRGPPRPRGRVVVCVVQQQHGPLARAGGG